mgnify:CR=1 FL=1
MESTSREGLALRGAKPGEYVVEVGLYRISDLTRLPVLAAGQSPPAAAVDHEFGTDTNDVHTLESVLYRLVEQAGARLRQRRQAARFDQGASRRVGVVPGLLVVHRDVLFHVDRDVGRLRQRAKVLGTVRIAVRCAAAVAAGREPDHRGPQHAA